MTARANVVMAVKMAGAYFTYKTVDQFRARLWGASQRLFKGGRDANFIGTFARSIDVELTKAWNKGADEMGFDVEAMTDEDRAALDEIIAAQNSFIDGMVNDIIKARDSGMDPAQFQTTFGYRVDMWANRYNETINAARLHFGGKKRLEWVLGPTEVHCRNNERPGGWGCADMAGTVATAQEWEKAGVRTQGDMLSCRGFNCLCQLKPTDKRRTRGGIPRP